MNPRQRRGLLLLVISALGLIGVFVLVAGYVADVRTEVDPKIRVLALSKSVQANTSIGDDAVTTVVMPERWAPPTAMRDRLALVGKVAASDLTKGSLLQEGMAVDPPVLGPGQREIAILVDAETGVAGKVRPGMLVDIIATFPGDTQRDIPPRSTVVVGGARIIDVGQTQVKGANGKVQQENEDPKQVVPVTFALTPRENLRVTEAETNAAEVRLALLRPNETSNLKKDERSYVRPELR
jgi:pilus assembly protein CpaB